MASDWTRGQSNQVKDFALNIPLFAPRWRHLRLVAADLQGRMSNMKLWVMNFEACVTREPTPSLSATRRLTTNR